MQYLYQRELCRREKGLFLSISSGNQNACLPHGDGGETFFFTFIIMRAAGDFPSGKETPAGSTIFVSRVVVKNIFCKSIGSVSILICSGLIWELIKTRTFDGVMLILCKERCSAKEFCVLILMGKVQIIDLEA